MWNMVNGDCCLQIGYMGVSWSSVIITAYCVNGGFKCDNGQCTAQSGDRCDGIKHCSDGSDESIKVCSSLRNSVPKKLRQSRQAMIETTQSVETYTMSSPSVPSNDPTLEVHSNISDGMWQNWDSYGPILCNKVTKNLDPTQTLAHALLTTTSSLIKQYRLC